MAANSPKLNIPRLSLCVHLCHVISHDFKFSFNGNVYYYWEFSYFSRKKNNFLKNFNSRTHHRMCLILCRWIVLGISLKRMPSFQKLFEGFEKSRRQNLYACGNQVFYFQMISRTTKIVENRVHAFLTSTKCYLSTKNEIHVSTILTFNVNELGI